MNKKKAAPKKKSKASAKKTRIPRQTPLPGIGDEKIAAIENAALDYAEIRDERQLLTKREVETKGKLIDLMHAKKLTEYKRNGISVKLVVEEETVKVRVKSKDDLDAPSSNAEVSVEQTEESEPQPD